jgi:melibiose permease/lactose/raffinose/galactose permease
MSDTVKNRFSFGIGTLGRDFYYSFVTGYLLFFLTDVRNISSTTLAIIGVLFTVLRLFDAVNDPISGWIVDNTKTKMNKFKFWQLWGMLIGIIFSFFMFSILPVSNSSPWFLVIFIVSYLGFDIFFGLNDTAYWGMLPTLSNDSGTRNKDTSVARIFANIGGFIIAVLIHPITQGLSKIFNPDLPKDQSNIQGWMIFFGIASLFMILTSFITIIFVKPKVIEVENADLKIGLKDVFTTIGRNDQLLISGLCMFTLMSG